VHWHPIAWCDSTLRVTAGNDIVGTFGTTTALAGNAQFELDVIIA
jgi:hypothetical protein